MLDSGPESFSNPHFQSPRLLALAYQGRFHLFPGEGRGKEEGNSNFYEPWAVSP